MIEMDTTTPRLVELRAMNTVDLLLERKRLAAEYPNCQPDPLSEAIITAEVEAIDAILETRYQLMSGTDDAEALRAAITDLRASVLASLPWLDVSTWPISERARAWVLILAGFLGMAILGITIGLTIVSRPPI